VNRIRVTHGNAEKYKIVMETLKDRDHEYLALDERITLKLKGTLMAFTDF
jgi:hypothetical protein